MIADVLVSIIMALLLYKPALWLARKIVAPLPESEVTAGCFGNVVSSFPKDGKIVMVYNNGCVETK